MVEILPIYTRIHRGQHPEPGLARVGDTNRPHSVKASVSQPSTTLEPGEDPDWEGQREVSWPYLASIQRILFSR